MALAKHNRAPAQINRRSLLAALPAVAAVPAAVIAQPADPMVSLCEQYIDAFHAWEAASFEPGEGNFDGPLTTPIAAEKERLEQAIKDTPIASPAGLSAFCRFVHTDNWIGDGSDPFPGMAYWQWTKIAEYAEARALVA